MKRKKKLGFCIKCHASLKSAFSFIIFCEKSFGKIKTTILLPLSTPSYTARPPLCYKNKKKNKIKLFSVRNFSEQKLFFFFGFVNNFLFLGENFFFLKLRKILLKLLPRKLGSSKRALIIWSLMTPFWFQAFRHFSPAHFGHLVKRLEPIIRVRYYRFDFTTKRRLVVLMINKKKENFEPSLRLKNFQKEIQQNNVF